MTKQERDELRVALTVAQESAIIQLLLEICLPTEEDKKVCHFEVWPEKGQTLTVAMGKQCTPNYPLQCSPQPNLHADILGLN